MKSNVERKGMIIQSMIIFWIWHYYYSEINKKFMGTKLLCFRRNRVVMFYGKFDWNDEMIV